MQFRVVTLSVIFLSSQAVAQSLEYSADDLANPAVLKTKLAEQGATFEIVTEAPVPRSLGIVPPPNLPELVVKQRALASAIEQQDPGRPTKLGEFTASNYTDDRRQCDPKARHFSWEELGHIKDTEPADGQGQCGSCWAFASVAAVQAGLSIRQKQSTADQPVDIAEQDLLNCSEGGSCDGGWWDDAFGVMSRDTPHSRRTSSGVLGETIKTEYDGKKHECLSGGAGEYKIANWAYVADQGASIPSDKAIKNALCARGPLVTAVLATPLWSR
jgi:hypothetical protein